MSKTKIVIIGAGPTGLGAGYRFNSWLRADVTTGPESV